MSLLGVTLLGRALSSSDARGAYVISYLADDPRAILADYSFADRLLGLYVGLYWIPEHPFGSFDVRVDPDATNAALNGDLAIFIWPDSSFRSLLVDLRALRYDNHGIGAMFERMGLSGVLIALGLIFCVRGFRGKWVVRIFTLGLFLNASFFIPTLWFIVGCCVERLRLQPAPEAHRKSSRVAGWILKLAQVNRQIEFG